MNATRPCSHSRRLLCIALAAPLIESSWAQSAAPFRLGVAPHTSARVILEMYQPLRAFLEQTLQRPVDVVTAPNFTEFARQMLAQAYDLAITTGHQARLAQTDADYTPLLTYAADFRSVIVVAGAGPIQTSAQLKGQPLLGLSPTSLVTLWGQHWLAQQGVLQKPNYVSASDSVARQVIEGQAAAGFISLANYQSLPRDMQSRLRFLVISAPMAGRVYLLNARHRAQHTALHDALLRFASTPAAQAYFTHYKLDGYRELRPGELEAMTPYASEVRASLR